MSSKTSTIEDVLTSLNKKNDFHIGSLADTISDVRALTTGNLTIDELTSVGGLPIGRTVELYGNYSSGKTTCALQTAASLQQQIIATGSDDRIIYMDYEHAVDRKYAASLGLNMDHPSFIFAQPTTFEQGAQAARELIATGKVRLVIWDSVAAMTPKAILEGEIGDVTVGLQARLMSQLLKTLTSDLNHYDCTSIFINQIRDKISTGGRPGADNKETPGGRALKFYSSVRLEFTQLKKMKGKKFNPLTNADEEFIVATDVLVKVVKNKVGDPFREAVVRVRYGKGFDNLYSALNVLVNYRSIQPGAAGYYYFDKDTELEHPDMSRSSTGRPTIHGEAAVLQFAEDHPGWKDLLISKAQALLDVHRSDTLEPTADTEEEYDG